MKKRISLVVVLSMLLSLFSMPMVANAEFVDYSEWYLSVDEDFGSDYTLGAGGVTLQKPYGAFWSTADGMISGVVQNDGQGGVGVSSASENFVIEFDMKFNEYRPGYSDIEMWWNIDKNNATNHIRALLSNNSLVMEKTWGGYNYQTLSTTTGVIKDVDVWHSYRISLIGATTTIQEKIDGEWVEAGSYTNPNYSSAEAANGRTIEFNTAKAFTSFDNIKVYIEEVPETFPVDYSDWYAEVDLDFADSADKDEVNCQYPANWTVANGVLSGKTDVGNTGNIDIPVSASDYVIEFDVKLDSYLTASTNPQLWWYFRFNTANQNRFLVQDSNICYEAGSYASQNIQLLSNKTSLPTLDEWHSYRIAVIGADYTIQEKSGNYWLDVATYTDNDYQATETAGDFRIGAGRAVFSLDNIKIYVEDAPQVEEYTYTFYDADGTTVLKTETIEDGEVIVAPAAPTKAEDSTGIYVFTGWEGFTEGMTISEDVTFTATYKTWYTNVDLDFADSADKDSITFKYPTNWGIVEGALKSISTDSSGWIRMSPDADDYILEFDLRTDSLFSGTNPKYWWNFRVGTNNAHRFYAQDVNIAIEHTWGQFNFNSSFTPGFGSDTNVWKTYRISVIGADYTIQQKVDGVWTNIGTYTQSAYSSDVTGGTIELSAGNALWSIDNIKLYTETQPTTPPGGDEGGDEGEGGDTSSFPDYSTWYAETDEDFSAFALNNPGNIYVQKPFGAYWSVADGIIKAVEVTDGNGGLGFTSTTADVIVELDARVDKFIGTATTPTVWVNIDKAHTTNHIRGLIESDKFYIEKTWGGYNYETLSTSVGTMGTAGVWHTYRFALIGGTITVQEKINDVWTDIGSYTNPNYDATIANGRTFEFNAGKAYMSYDNIKVYIEQPEVSVDCAFDGLSMVPTNVSIPLTFGVATTEQALVETLTVKESGIEVTDYTLTVAEDGLSAAISFDGGLKHTTSYEVVIGGESVATFSTGYALYKANLEEDASNFNLKDATFVAAGGKLTATTQGGTWAEIKDVNVENFGLSFTETRTGEPPSTASDDRLWYNLKYHVANDKENYVQLRFNKANITTYPFVNGAWGDGKTLSGHTPLSQDVPQDVYFAGKGNELFVFVKYNGDDNYTFIGKLDNFAGDAGTIRFIPVRNVTYDNINLYLPAELTAELAESPAPVAAGSELVFNFSGDIKTAPATVTITDTDGASYTATVNTKENKKQLGIVLPQALNYSYTYTVDFTGVVDINGTAGQATEFVTWDKAPEYSFTNPVYYKVTGTEEAPVYTEIPSLTTGKIKVTRNVTKEAAEAAGTVVMVTAVYREEGALDSMVVCKTTTSETLTLDTASEISTVVDVPADGAAYYIRTFVWQNLTTCNPLAQMKEFK